MSIARPLFWRKATDHPQDTVDHGWIADGISGRYSAQKQRDGSWLLWWAHDNFIWEACATFTECKDKAEADWQRRFREHLAAACAGDASPAWTAAPVGVEAMREALTADRDGGVAGPDEGLQEAVEEWGKCSRLLSDLRLTSLEPDHPISVGRPSIVRCDLCDGEGDLEGVGQGAYGGSHAETPPDPPRVECEHCLGTGECTTDCDDCAYAAEERANA